MKKEKKMFSEGKDSGKEKKKKNYSCEINHTEENKILKNNTNAQKCNQISVVNTQGIHNLFFLLTIF